MGGRLFRVRSSIPTDVFTSLYASRSRAQKTGRDVMKLVQLAASESSIGSIRLTCFISAMVSLCFAI